MSSGRELEVVDLAGAGRVVVTAGAAITELLVRGGACVEIVACGLRADPAQPASNRTPATAGASRRRTALSLAHSVPG